MIRIGRNLLTAIALCHFFFGPAFADDRPPEVILGSCATALAPDDNRTKNIDLAMKRLNGQMVEPGKVFSFNGVVGRRTAGRGFLPAPVLFQNRRNILIGGGVCQVSSTLYNAALLADLEIVERYRHSSPITYLPLGLDATVSYGYRDLKFRNTHPFPILITASLTEEMMTISVLGTGKLPYDVELVTEVSEIEAPFQDQGSESGKEVQRYRLKTSDGIVIEKEYLGRDYYHPVRAGE